MPFLSQISVYPVKSLAGFQTFQWPVVKTGLQYDRQWMVVDATGDFLSQRRLPRMALIQAQIQDDCLQLSAPDKPRLRLPIVTPALAQLPITIWHDAYLAEQVSLEADQWLSDFLGTECRLVKHPDHQLRQVDLAYAQAGDETAFSDGFPFLLLSEASFNSLNASSPVPLSLPRFRANLIIAGCKAFAEDHWRQIRINSVGFRLPKPCSRCSVPAVDPYTGLLQPDVLTALARVRQWQNKVYVGQNAVHDGLGMLLVGSEVVIEQLGEPQPALVGDSR